MEPRAGLELSIFLPPTLSAEITGVIPPKKIFFFEGGDSSSLPCETYEMHFTGESWFRTSSTHFGDIQSWVLGSNTSSATF
jgi:hypothetical protein